MYPISPARLFERDPLFLRRLSARLQQAEFLLDAGKVRTLPLGKFAVFFNKRFAVGRDCRVLFRQTDKFALKHGVFSAQETLFGVSGRILVKIRVPASIELSLDLFARAVVVKIAVRRRFLGVFPLGIGNFSFELFRLFSVPFGKLRLFDALRKRADLVLYFFRLAIAERFCSRLRADKCLVCFFCRTLGE